LLRAELRDSRLKLWKTKPIFRFRMTDSWL